MYKGTCRRRVPPSAVGQKGKEIAQATTSTAKRERQKVPPKGLPNYTRSQVRRSVL
jgi:hypothetical protein